MLYSPYQKRSTLLKKASVSCALCSWVCCASEELPAALVPPSPPLYNLLYERPNAVPHKSARKGLYGVGPYSNKSGAKGHRVTQSTESDIPASRPQPQ